MFLVRWLFIATVGMVIFGRSEAGPVIVWAGVIAIAYPFLRPIWMELVVEALCPMKYPGVSIDELEGHIEELWRRGYDGSQLVIAPEGTKRMLRVRKRIVAVTDVNSVDLSVIADTADCSTESRSAFVAFVEEKGLSHGRYSGGLVSNPDVISVRCGDSPQVATAIAGRALHQLFCVDQDVACTVWIRGSIGYQDKPIRVLGIHRGDLLSKLRDSVPHGKPYKRLQRPGFVGLPIYYVIEAGLKALSRGVRWVFGK